jgi:hypothetical protein
VTAVEWLLWLASVWSTFLVYVLIDGPDLCARLAHHMRQQHLPHWARHGHLPPADDPVPPHGRDRASRSH